MCGFRRSRPCIQFEAGQYFEFDAVGIVDEAIEDRVGAADGLSARIRLNCLKSFWCPPCERGASGRFAGVCVLLCQNRSRPSERVLCDLF